jgi:TRAP-type C4-dicarboxylate transport system substrate-binding protein
MRKANIFMVLVSVIVMASLILSACSSSPTTTAPPPKTAAPTTAAAATTAAPLPVTTVAPPTPAVPKVFNLKFSYHTPPTASLVGAYFKPWTAAVEQATNGQVKITHYGAETLVKAKDQYDGLVSGLSDIAMVDTSETPGRFPTTEFDTLPYIFPDAGNGAKIYWDTLQKYSVANDLKEVKLIGVAVIAPSNYIGNKEAKNLSDFKGLRIRTAGKTESWTVEALGATPTEIATADLGTSMERGLIDGAFLSYSLMLSMGIKDVTKYRTECNLFYRAWPILMNKKVWDSMPADVQNAIMSASGQANSATYSTDNEKLAAGAKNAIIGSDKGQGKAAIYTLTADQLYFWKSAVMPVWDKWSADLEGKKQPGKAIIEDVKTLTQKYTAK